MSEYLAINGGTPVLKRSDYGNWPIITEDDRRFINEVLDSGIVAGGTALVRQFFLNGGGESWVVRLAKNAGAAMQVLQNAASAKRGTG